ncbi:protein of unknown function [Rhodovastum atsumiense]|nr:protein of unknown function [Rhodovastum atsumiense]
MGPDARRSMPSWTIPSAASAPITSISADSTNGIRTRRPRRRYRCRTILSVPAWQVAEAVTLARLGSALRLAGGILVAGPHRRRRPVRGGAGLWAQHRALEPAGLRPPLGINGVTSTPFRRGRPTTAVTCNFCGFDSNSTQLTVGSPSRAPAARCRERERTCLMPCAPVPSPCP